MKTYTMDEWMKDMERCQVSKAQLDSLVLNYLFTEGYKDAAERLAQEANIQHTADLSSIDERMTIRTAVENGDILKAIERVNELNPEILDTEPALIFHLQKQRLLEIIRAGDMQQALVFAQEELAPQAEDNLKLLEELEETMTLLAFPDYKMSPFGYLMDVSYRQKVAGELNAAILRSQSQAEEPRLVWLIKMVKWGQLQLKDKIICPVVNDYSKVGLTMPEEDAKNV